jgi:GWxTD domain-containing protein
MAVAEIRPLRPTSSIPWFVFLLVVLYSCLIPHLTEASLVRQMEGSGQFHTYVEVINRWVSEDRLDVLVLVEVGNTEIGFKREERGLVARLNLEVELVGPDGQTITGTNQIRTKNLPAIEAGSSTLSQVFGLILEDVPLHSGRLTCQVFDVNRRREGIFNQYQRNNYSSLCATDWAVEPGPRAPQGLAVEDPLFLVHAPIKTWNPDYMSGDKKVSDWLHDFIHPSRRYGIEQDKLQLAFPVWPPAGGVPLEDDLPGLMVQAFSGDMTYTISDTIDFDGRARMAMLSGRPAWVFYELDLNLLPDGHYQLAIAPLGGHGRASLTGFDVVWDLGGMGRHRDLVQGEGRILFSGSDLERFLNGSLSEQEKMLEMFWVEHDPDPDSDFNSAYIEFQSRVAYVRSFLGGFGPNGVEDDRGLVHLLLGPPDEMQVNRLPMNNQDQDDAQVKVFDKYAPDRTSSARVPSDYSGAAPNTELGGIPMPYSRMAEAHRQRQQFSASHQFGFELWKYDAGGRPLFPNRFSMKTLSSRFLFIDRSGFGLYSLESSNLWQGEE